MRTQAFPLQWYGHPQSALRLQSMQVPFRLWAEQQSSQLVPKHGLPLTVHHERQMPFAAE